VAAEAGHKQLTLLLIKAGADMKLTDFKSVLDLTVVATR
jgi:hypothetical protein